MAEAGAPSPQELFKLWQNGDTASGQKMAQRFTDWCYAVTAVQLGEVAGRSPLEQACATFAQGITTITRSSELTDWAHGIVAREVRSAGGRGVGGDFPNALTGGRSPTDLLGRAKSSLTSTQSELAATFDADAPRRLDRACRNRTEGGRSRSSSPVRPQTCPPRRRWHPIHRSPGKPRPGPRADATLRGGANVERRRRGILRSGCFPISTSAAMLPSSPRFPTHFGRVRSESGHHNRRLQHLPQAAAATPASSAPSSATDSLRATTRMGRKSPRCGSCSGPQSA